jgi:hypothetical protein
MINSNIKIFKLSNFLKIIRANILGIGVGKFRLLLPQLLLITSFSMSSASDHFKEYIPFSNSWVIITATEKTSGKCNDKNEINTNFFTGLKSDLFVCVTGNFAEKEKALETFNKLPKGSAYIKYTGSFTDIPKLDSSFLKENLYFTIKLSDSVLLQCFQMEKKADSVFQEQGIEVVYNLKYQVYKNKKAFENTAIDVVSCLQFDKIKLDSNTVALTFIENAMDESTLHIICWSTTGEKKYSHEFYNSVSAEESETVSLEKIGMKYAVVTVNKTEGKPDQKNVIYWTGSTFK